MKPPSHTNKNRPAFAYATRGLFVRLVYLATAFAWWVLTGFGRLTRTRCVTLCYHGVTDQHRKRFRRQMRLAADRTIYAADTDGTRMGRRGPRVCVTFDDAFENLLINALPITRELGIQTTVFAVTGNLGSCPHWNMVPDHPDASEMTMTENQIRQAAADVSVTFGSHGATHRCLTRLAREEMGDEMTASRAELERITGGEVDDFAFPYGACDPAVIEAAFAAGYSRLFTLDPAGTRTVGSGRVIGRMSMSPAAWEVEFRLTIAGAYEWLPYIRNAARRVRAAMRGVPKNGEGRRSGLTAHLTGL